MSDSSSREEAVAVTIKRSKDEEPLHEKPVDKKREKSSKRKSNKKRRSDKKKSKAHDEAEDLKLNDLDEVLSLNEKKRAQFLARANPEDLVPESEKVQLSWRNITYQVPKEKRRFARCRGYGEMKTILNDVSGYVAPGQMVAIVGPSGAGKTSLLNVLAQRITMSEKPHRKLTGKVEFNGETLTRSEFGRISGFVAQDDILMGSSTCYEALMFAAEMTVGDEVPFEEKQTRVNNLINMMGLEKCKDNFIGFTGQAANNSGIKRGLSGGERKRLSVCYELIHEPRILFLDEPTSGLDSFAAATVVRSLQKLAFAGRTIVCTIHQPSSQIFNMFDKVIVLADGGITYFGRPEDAPSYYKKAGYAMPKFTNPADFMMRVVQVPKDVMNADAKSSEGEGVEIGVSLKNASRAQVKHLIATYKESDMYEDAIKPPAPPTPVSDDVKNVGQGCSGGYKTSYMRQFVLLCKRSWLNIVREPMLFQARLMQSLFTGILAGLIFLRLNYFQSGLGDRLSASFFLIISQMFGSINGPTFLFPVERGVYFREKQSGMYSPSLYFWSKLITQFPVNMLVPIVTAIVGWYMVGFNDDPAMFGIFLLVNIVLSNIAYSLGLVLSTLILDPSTVQKIQPLILLPFMLFGGFFLNADNTPVYFIWLRYWSFVNYSFRATMYAALYGQNFWCKAADFRSLPLGYAANSNFNLSAPMLYDANITIVPVGGNVQVGGNLTDFENAFKINICPITKGEQMLSFLGLEYNNGESWWTDIIIVFGMTLVYVCIAWIALVSRKLKY